MSISAAVMILCLVFSADGGEGNLEKNEPTFEIQQLSEIFTSEVSDFQPEEDYVQFVKQDILSQVSGWSESQYFVYADRNPEKQLILVGFWDSGSRDISIIGWDKISTGDPKHGKDYHLTPTGIFENTTDNVGYRARGTKNSKGWRGLGAKGSRVWDFGWQKTFKPRKGKLEERTIRLLLHATDPDQGELRLGKPDSKGCVRITAKLNKFLDHFGIIDAEYEKAEKEKPSWLLRKDRQPVERAGRYLIVGDSAAATETAIAQNKQTTPD
ncbi:MAG: L,D-transpeptidase [Patescibacteria group bacterium]